MHNHTRSSLSVHNSSKTSKPWLLCPLDSHTTDFTLEKSFSNIPYFPSKAFQTQKNSSKLHKSPDFLLNFPSSSIVKPFRITDRGLMNRDISILNALSGYLSSGSGKSRKHHKKHWKKKHKKDENIVKRHALGFSSIENLDFFKHYYRLLIKNMFILTKSIESPINPEKIDEKQKSPQKKQKESEFIPLEIRNFFIEKTKQDLLFFEKLLEVYEKTYKNMSYLGLNEFIDSEKFDRITNKINFLPMKPNSQSNKVFQIKENKPKLHIKDIKISGFEPISNVKVFKEEEFLKNLLKKMKNKGIFQVSGEELIEFKGIVKEKKEILKEMEKNFDILIKEKPKEILSNENLKDFNRIMSLEEKKENILVKKQEIIGEITSKNKEKIDLKRKIEVKTEGLIKKNEKIQEKKDAIYNNTKEKHSKNENIKEKVIKFEKNYRNLQESQQITKTPSQKTEETHEKSEDIDKKHEENQPKQEEINQKFEEILTNHEKTNKNTEQNLQTTEEIYKEIDVSNRKYENLINLQEKPINKIKKSLKKRKTSNKSIENPHGENFDLSPKNAKLSLQAGEFVKNNENLKTLETSPQVNQEPFSMSTFSHHSNNEQSNQESSLEKSSDVEESFLDKSLEKEPSFQEVNENSIEESSEKRKNDLKTQSKSPKIIFPTIKNLIKTEETQIEPPSKKYDPIKSKGNLNKLNQGSITFLENQQKIKSLRRNQATLKEKPQENDCSELNVSHSSMESKKSKIQTISQGLYQEILKRNSQGKKSDFFDKNIDNLNEFPLRNDEISNKITSGEKQTKIKVKSQKAQMSYRMTLKDFDNHENFLENLLDINLTENNKFLQKIQRKIREDNDNQSISEDNLSEIDEKINDLQRKLEIPVVLNGQKQVSKRISMGIFEIKQKEKKFGVRNSVFLLKQEEIKAENQHLEDLKLKIPEKIEGKIKEMNDQQEKIEEIYRNIRGLNSKPVEKQKKIFDLEEVDAKFESLQVEKKAKKEKSKVLLYLH